jgi:hypothetical protein
MKCDGYGRNEKSRRVLLQSVYGRQGLEDFGLDGRMINWIVKRVRGLNSSASRSDLVASCCEDGNGRSGSVRAESSLDCGYMRFEGIPSSQTCV